MSNGTAIAAVTEGLKTILHMALLEAGPVGVAGAVPTSVRPQSIDPTALGVNVFLYQVTPNAACRNLDLPTRREGGELIQRPQLALDLHYLLTFTGDEQTLVAQRIMGVALAGLYAHPVLTPAVIEGIVLGAPAGSYLELVDLFRQIDSVRFSLAGMNLEELSKLWSVFFQVQYQLSTAVVASVVMIEAPLVPSPRRPVRDRGIYSALSRPPSIASIDPQVTPRTSRRARARLTIRGAALRGEGTRVKLGNLDAVAIDGGDDIQILVSIPDALSAGVHLARVLVNHTFDQPGATRQFDLESNVLPFVLAPTITDPVPLRASVGGDLTMTVEPSVGRSQSVRAIVGRHAIAWTPPPPSLGGLTEFAQVTVRLPSEVVAGRYPLRVEVDGAVSALEDPLDPNAPGAIISPFVEVT